MSFCRYALKVRKNRRWTVPEGFQVTPRRFETNCFANRKGANLMCRELKEREQVKQCRVVKDRTGRRLTEWM